MEYPVTHGLWNKDCINRRSARITVLQVQYKSSRYIFYQTCWFLTTIIKKLFLQLYYLKWNFKHSKVSMFNTSQFQNI